MTYTAENFLEDVRTEIEAIKEHATKEEINRLDFTRFNAGSATECIYGQMTGNCVSHRAHFLIHKGCRRLVDNTKYTATSAENAAECINGEIKSIDHLDMLRGNLKFNYLSTLEAYIMIHHDSNRNLIQYLKGERNDLVL